MLFVISVVLTAIAVLAFLTMRSKQENEKGENLIDKASKQIKKLAKSSLTELVVSWKAHRGVGRHLGKLIRVEKSGRRGIVERVDGLRFRRSMANIRVHGTL